MTIKNIFHHHTPTSWAHMVAQRIPAAQLTRIIKRMSLNELQTLEHYWPFWCHAHQRPPQGDYNIMHVTHRGTAMVSMLLHPPCWRSTLYLTAQRAWNLVKRL